MTSIAYHTYNRIGWRRSRHAFLVDIGEPIGIRLTPMLPVKDHGSSFPATTETRFFEIEIDEITAQGKKTFAFQNIVPVHARRRPEWHILKLRIRRGSWTITGRIPPLPAAGGTQWIYTDDFNILFLSAGGGHDLDTLISLITARLDAIAQSVRSGARILSQFESQREYREAFGTLFGDGMDVAFRTTVLYREHSPSIPGRQPGTGALHAEGVIRNRPGSDTSALRPGTDISVDLGQIEELNDLGWLME